MKFIADLHIHSSYSRATAKDISLQSLEAWARKKGLKVAATGDVTHPKWFEELKNNLKEAEPGFFRLNEESEIRFCLSTEISSIYKSASYTDPSNVKVRRVHNLLLFPSFDAAERFISRLQKLGNLKSDGRPILGVSSHDLLEILLETDYDSFMIPAHIWTPHFSVLGAFSDFDSIESCFGDLSEYIFALETGLSADPSMCWRVSSLDRFSFVSNSDAHSPANLGREANIFNCGFDFHSMKKALQTKKGFEGTIEFFPEEGKYYLDGDRNCKRRMTPSETKKNHGKCPDCGVNVTVGVLNRVESLADREEGVEPQNALPFRKIIPLQELLGEILNSGSKSKKVAVEYEKIVENIASELEFLLNIPISEISKLNGEEIASAVDSMRKGNVIVEPGYDGVYGIIKTRYLEKSGKN